MKADNSAYSFLSGGGKMGELIRAKDWNNTPLGEPDTWPQSLRTMVSVMLDNPFGMYIAWGPEYTQIYNDGYRPILGTTKHPHALGASTRETFAEIWHIIESMFADVMDGKPVGFPDFMLPLNRHGYVEACYFDFSYSPIRKQDGSVGGVLVTVMETTNKKKAEDELIESESQLQFAIEAAELATFDYNPVTNRFSCNQRLKEWFGLPGTQDVDLSLAMESILKSDRKRVSSAIANALDYQNKKKFDIEYTVNNPVSRQRRIVRAKGKVWFDEEREPYRFNGTLQDVTEQAQALRKIQSSEKNFRNMILQAPVAMCILSGPDYVVEVANKYALELWGRAGSEVENKPLFESITELVEQGIKDQMDSVRKTGLRFFTHEMPVQLLRNGVMETRYLDYSFEPLLDEEHKVNGIMPIGIDITQQVLARQKIEASEEKLNIVINASDLGIWEFDLVTQKADCSERALEMLGFPGQPEVYHKQMLENFHPDDISIREKAFAEAFKTGSLNYEARVFWKDKSVHWIEAKGKVFYDADKVPVRMLGTLRDISAGKVSQQQLQKSEEKFRLLADSMPQFVWTGDPRGVLNYFNQSVYNYSGLSQENIEQEGWLQIVHPDDAQENIKAWIKSVSSGKDFLFEHRFRRHDGEYRWQLSRAIPQRDARGNIQMWVGTSTDIQDQKEFAAELEEQVFTRTQELNQKNIDLERMNKELQSFAYISSHDLQEPLRKIQTFASRIAETESQNISEHGKDYLGRMQKAAHRMQTLIQDLLAYSRTNVRENTFEVVPLDEVINQVKDDLKEELSERNVEVHMHGMCDLKIISFQFHQLFMNLISNSIKFARADRSLSIQIRCEIVSKVLVENNQTVVGQKYCHIHYSDNGVGFDPQFNEKVFELFQRVHDKTEYSGTGIGLSIVKKIVENHSGFIKAVGNLEKGAIFDIFVPVADSDRTL